MPQRADVDIGVAYAHAGREGDAIGEYAITPILYRQTVIVSGLDKGVTAIITAERGEAESRARRRGLSLSFRGQL